MLSLVLIVLINLQAKRHAGLLKRDSKNGVSLWNLRKLLETPIVKNICERLFLVLVVSLNKTLYDKSKNEKRMWNFKNKPDFMDWIIKFT